MNTYSYKNIVHSRAHCTSLLLSSPEQMTILGAGCIAMRSLDAIRMEDGVPSM
jgi:hypothetical protein